MSQTTIETLEMQIEKLVTEHIATVQKAAVAAVGRAFSRSTVPGAERRAKDQSTPTPRRAGHRRPTAELAALTERLYAAICERPGRGMIELAAEIGTTPRALNRPAVCLRRAGRLRSVGERQATRYFPLIPKTGTRE